MAVFRVEKTKDYTVLSNHHLKNRTLSLKAKGLLSVMLSLPDTWDFTLKGLSRINREGVDAIREAIRELEREGYIVRRRIRDEHGLLRGAEYVIYEKPQKQELPAPDEPAQHRPALEQSALGHPTLENPAQEKPALENPAQSNTNPLNTYSSNTQGFNPHPSIRAQEDELDWERIQRTRREVMEQIEYEAIVQPHNREMLGEIVELMTETLCSTRERITISGEKLPAEYVKDRLRRLTCAHIEFVFEALRQKRTEVHHIKQYMLTTLFNAPITIEHYYDAQARHERLI